MKEFIKTSIYCPEEVIGLTISICKQLNIPCRGKQDAGNFIFQRELINSLSGKYKINASVGNNCFYYSKSLNLIAESLVSRNILNEDALRQDLEEFYLANPPLRL